MVKMYSGNIKKMLDGLLQGSGLLLAYCFLLMQVSCVFDDNTPLVIGDFEEVANKVPVTVQIKAPAEDENRDDMDIEFDPGVSNEYVVCKVDLYFFDSQSKYMVKRVPLTNLVIDEYPEDGDDEDDTDGDSRVTYLCDDIDIEEGTYDIFAVANCDKDISAVDEQTFLATVDDSTYADGVIESTSEDGFVMTNRVTSNLGYSVKVTQKNTLVVSLERAVSKVEIGQTSNSYLLFHDFQVYATVNLTNYKVVNLSRKFFYFRHVALLNSFVEPVFELGVNFGKVPTENGYVIDPYFFKKTSDATGFDNADGYYANHLSDVDTYSNWSSMNVAGNYSLFYVLENCMYQTAQKNAYTTGVLFKAAVYPNGNVYKWDSNKEMLVLVDKKADWTSPLYFYDYKFYTSLKALEAAGAAVDVDAVYNDAELLTKGIKRFKKNNGTYQCYYNYWIKHLDNDNPTQMGVMEYGIVRNNVYRLQVSSVGELGFGTLAILPNQNDEPISYIDADMQVGDWTVAK